MMSLGAVPDRIDPEQVERVLAGMPGVIAVHDLHIWPAGTTDTVMTAHLVIAGGHPGNVFLSRVQRIMRDGFGIGHVTVQVEIDETADCDDCGAPTADVQARSQE